MGKIVYLYFRHAALCVLHIIIKQCSTAVFIDYSSTWSLLLVKTLEVSAYIMYILYLVRIIIYDKDFKNKKQ